MSNVAKRGIGFTNEAAGPPLVSGGGPPHDGGMEARVAKLEANYEHISRDVADLRADVKDLRRDLHGVRTTDFRILFGAIIAVALGLAGIMARGFGWL